VSKQSILNEDQPASGGLSFTDSTVQQQANPVAVPPTSAETPVVAAPHASLEVPAVVSSLGEAEGPTTRSQRISGRTQVPSARAAEMAQRVAECT
jgi:hypothetical protein